MQAKSTIQAHYNEEKFIITYIYINDTMSKFLNMEEVERIKQELSEHYSVKTMNLECKITNQGQYHYYWEFYCYQMINHKQGESRIK